MFSGVAPLFHVSSLPETELSITQDADNGLEAELNPIEDARSKWVVLCPAFTSIYIYIAGESAVEDCTHGFRTSSRYHRCTSPSRALPRARL